MPSAIMNRRMTVPPPCERFLASGSVSVPGGAATIPGTGHWGPTAAVSCTVIVGGGSSGPIAPTPPVVENGCGRDPGWADGGEGVAETLPDPPPRCDAGPPGTET